MIQNIYYAAKKTFKNIMSFKSIPEKIIKIQRKCVLKKLVDQNITVLTFRQNQTKHVVTLTFFDLVRKQNIFYFYNFRIV